MKCLFLFINLLNFFPLFTLSNKLEKECGYEDVIAVNSESYVGVYKTDSELVINDEVFLFEGYTVNTIVDSINNIYLVCNDLNSSTIIMFNKFSKTYELLCLDDTYIDKIYDINKSIFIIGSMNNNGLIMNLDYDLNLITKKTFNSDGNMLVNNLIVDDYIYITIYKDGITNNSDFISHGNYLDKKSILVKLDFNYQIINTYYFDEDSCDEIVKSIFIKDNFIKVLLKTSKKHYIYNLDKDLSTASYYSLDIKDDIELINHYKSTNDDLLINKTKSILLRANPSEINIINEFNNFKGISDFKIIKGKLYLFGINNKLLIEEYLEYEVLKNETKYLNIYDLDYQDTSNIIIESWFEKLNISIGNIEPYFEKKNSGNYNVEYLVEHEDESITIIEGILEVSEFTNFIDNGIYNTGKVLEFFGTAKLNGETIYYGTELNEEGEYDIEITNANMQTTNYHIYIVDNYYKEEKVVNTNYSNIYKSNTLESAFVNIEIGDYDIKNVIINDEVYNDYEIIDNVLSIEFHKSFNKSYYKLNGLNVNNNGHESYIPINIGYIINFLKDAPSLHINPTIEEKLFSLDINVLDEEKSFMYLKAVTNDFSKIITNSDSFITKDLKLYLVYEISDNKTHEILISQINHTIPTNVNIYLNYEDGKLNLINLDYNIDTKYINELVAYNTSYLDYYKKLKHNSFLPNVIFISIGIIIFIGGSFCVYLLIKKVKKGSF